ncbi:MAG: hypothetical protein IIB95_04395 [Candidatus Marinimicrobia bacterium]|nr:hypothetical protein [Candidatus Neomarinimicrobiota bacterium]
MNFYKYNLSGLWFQVYREVLAQNGKFENDRLDKVQLREVTTTIFIASTQRGIVRPYSYSKFQVALLELTKNLHGEKEQKKVYTTVRKILNNRNKKEKANGSINTG